MFEIRAATKDDYPLIFATWLRSYRHGAHFPRHVPHDRYFAAHHDIAEELLEDSVVRVATPPADPDVILGWSVVETLEPPDTATPSPLAVHFVYVKPAFRRMGVGRALLASVARAEAEGAPVLFTHETFALKAPEIAVHVARWTFDPYLALRRGR